MPRIDAFTGWQWASDDESWDDVIARDPAKIHLQYCNIDGKRVPCVALYSCPCGCGLPVILPVAAVYVPKECWGIALDGDKVTITPSVHRLDHCRAHYFIEDNRVRWA